MAVKNGYKQTEVGVIPEGWAITSLRSVLDPSRHIRYGVVQPGEFVLQGQLMLRSQDYSKGWMGPDEMHRISSSLEKQYRNARINSGDLIMTIVGAGIGQVVSAPDWLDGAILSRSTCRIAVDPRKAAKGYIAAFLESPFGWRQILDCQKEGAQPVVSCPDLARFIIPLPTLAEQEAIAGALSDADAWIESLEQLIAKKRQIKQGAMQELLTGKRRLPGFSGEWETKRLGDHCRFLRNGTNSRADLSVDGPLRYLHYGDIHSCNGVYLTPNLLPSLPMSKANTLDRLQDGDLVVVDASEDTIGISKSIEIVGVDGFELVAGLHTIAVRFSAGIFAPRFVGLLQHCPDFNSHLRKLAAGTKVYATNRRHVSSAEVSIPSLTEQTAIATVLSDMDTEIGSLETKLAKAREVKQGMMQELLTGRIRLV